MTEYTANIIPIFTSSNPVDGVSITATPFVTNFEGWRMLTATTGNGWYPNNSTSGKDKGIVTIDFGKQRLVGKYTFTSGSYFPKIWTVQGSNTGLFSGEQEILSTVIDNGTIPTGRTTKEYFIENPKLYRYYRFDITNSVSGTFLQIVKLEMMEKLPFSKILLLSNDEVFSTSPSFQGKALENNLTSNENNSVKLFGTQASTTVELWRAFDGTTARWASNSYTVSTPVIFTVNFKDRKRNIFKYSLKCDNSASYLTQMPKKWEFQGSNDSVTWTTIDTRQNQTSWVANEKREYIVSSPNSYQNYRFNFIENNGNISYIGLEEIELFEKTMGDIFSIPSHSEQNLIKYGMDSPVQVDGIFSSKNYILQDTVSENAEGLWATQINRKPLDIKFE